MTDTSKFYKRLEDYVSGLFETHEAGHLTFHNIEHTRSVVVRASEIAGHYDISDADMRILQMAAWFHDTGYLVGPAAEHEENSVLLMKEFAEVQSLLPHEVESAAACIMATKKLKDPETLLEKILCDADSYHLGTKDFKKTNKDVYDEFYTRPGIDKSKSEYQQDTIGMLARHRYYTDYCSELLTDIKLKNMKSLEKKAAKKQKQELKDSKQAEVREQEIEDAGHDMPLITEKKSGTTKGMQTMLRLTSTNHIQLSEMADNKANILISVNAIIISIIISVLLRKLQTDPYLAVPTMVFLFFSVVTMVLGILATRPKTNTGIFADEDVANKKTNLLFFGNFHNMELNQYENAMRSMMKDSDYLYGSMVQDIYYLGKVLGRKYKLLRWAYNIFMVGIIISVILFAFFSMYDGSGAGSQATIKDAGGSPF
jgi:predicted metal-dependent HD superfamily phosphohydrolase